MKKKNEEKKETLGYLREQIEEYRKQLMELENLGEKLIDVLILRDKIKELSLKLEKKGIDLSAEKSRLDSLDHIIKDKPRFVWKNLKEFIDPITYREKNKIPSENWWWYLDRIIKEEKQRKKRKWILRMSTIAAVIASIYFIFTYVVPKPEPYVVCLEEANRLFEEGKLNEALETYKKAIRLDPDQGEPYLMIGIIYKFLTEDEKAEEYFTRAKKRYSSQADFYLQRGMTWLRLGEYVKAEEDAKKALDIDPKNVEAHFLLGNAYEAQGQIAKAIAEFSIVSETSEDPKLTVIARYKIGMLTIRGVTSQPPK